MREDIVIEKQGTSHAQSKAVATSKVFRVEALLKEDTVTFKVYHYQAWNRPFSMDLHIIQTFQTSVQIDSGDGKFSSANTLPGTLCRF